MQFKYNFLSLLRSRVYLFWTLAFPIVLGTLFFFAFGNNSLEFDFEPIPITIVQQDDSGAAFVNMLNELSQGDNPLINIIEAVHLQEAETLLANGVIDGFFILSDEIELIVLNSNNFVSQLNRSILLTMTNEFSRTYEVIENISEENPTMIFEILEQMRSGIEINRGTPRLEVDTNIYHFYALLAMVAFMGSQLGTRVGMMLKTGETTLAARLFVAPTRKIKVVINSFLASLVVHMILIAIVLFFLIFVLGINFGNQLHFTLLTCLMGSLAGISFGMLIAIVVKGKEGFKDGVATAISFVFYATGGLFSSQLRLIARRAIPVIDYINPISLISDAFTSSILFDTYDVYIRTIVTLFVMTIGFLIISAVALRRA